MITRLDPKVRKEQILEAAVQRALVLGITGLRRDDVAIAACVADALVSKYFNTMTQLRRAVMRHAVHNKILPIVAQGIALRDPEALKASPELQAQALATLAS